MSTATSTEVPVADFKRALRTVKPALPAWQKRVRIYADGFQLYVEATSGEAHARVVVALSDATFDTGIEFERLAVLQRTSARSVGVSVKDGKLCLALGKRIASLAASPVDWPDVDLMPDGANRVLEGNWLSSVFDYAPATALLKRAVTHVHKDDYSRPLLTGICFDPRGYLIATDSHRLIVLELPNALADDAAPLVIPGVLLVKAAGTEAELEVSEKDVWVYVKTGDARWRLRKLEGQYPSWEQLFPDEEQLTVRAQIEREALLESAKECQALLGKSSQWSQRRPLVLTPGDDAVGLDATEGENSVTESVAWATSRLAEPDPVGIEARYLAEALDALTGDTVWIEWASPIRPITIRGADGKALVMPVRLGGQ